MNIYNAAILEKRRLNIQTAEENWVEQLNWVEIGRKITPQNWEEAKRNIIAKLNEEGISLSDTEINTLQDFFTNIGELAKKMQEEITWVESIIDEAIKQLQVQNSGGTVSITLNKTSLWDKALSWFMNIVSWLWLVNWDVLWSGWEVIIDFSSKEEAYKFLFIIKNILSEASSNPLFFSTDAFILRNIKDAGISAFRTYNDAILKILKWAVNIWGSTTEDGNLIMGSILFWIIWFAGVTGINKFLSEVNTWVPREKFEELSHKIRENIKLYEEAWMEDEVGNLKKLLRNIDNVHQEVNGILDNDQKTRQIYMYLQAYRDNKLVDWKRFVMANIGNFFDGPLYKWSVVPTSLSDIPRIAWGLYTLPFKFWVKTINRWPNGWILGWKFQSKGNVILSTIDEFDTSNKKFSSVFKLIDELDGFSDTEKRSLKAQILWEYQSTFGIGKYDPIKKWKLISPISLDPETKANIYSALEWDLKANWNNISIKNWWDFIKNLPKVWARKAMGYMSQFLPAFQFSNPLINIDKLSADILEKAIWEKISYTPKMRTVLATMRKNASHYEKNRESIWKVADIYDEYIKFHPEISDTDEKNLRNILSIERMSSLTDTAFKERMNQVLSEKFPWISFDDVNNFYSDTSWQRVLTSQISSELTRLSDTILWEMERYGEISPAERVQRFTSIQNFMSGNKTFWNPHLSVIIWHLIKGDSYNSITDIIPMIEVEEFIKQWNHIDTLNYLRKYSNNVWGRQNINNDFNATNPTPESSRSSSLENLEKLSYDEIKDILDRAYFEALLSWNDSALEKIHSDFVAINDSTLPRLHEISSQNDPLGYLKTHYGLWDIRSRSSLPNLADIKTSLLSEITDEWTKVAFNRVRSYGALADMIHSTHNTETWAAIARAFRKLQITR